MNFRREISSKKMALVRRGKYIPTHEKYGIVKLPPSASKPYKKKKQTVFDYRNC